MKGPCGLTVYVNLQERRISPQEGSPLGFIPEVYDDGVADSTHDEASAQQGAQGLLKP